MKKSKRISLNYFLSKYSEELSYDDIMKLLSEYETEDKEGNKIVIREPFDIISKNYLSQLINKHREILEKEYNSEEDDLPNQEPVQSHLFKNPYIRLELNDITINVKLDEEGVVIDALNKDGEIIDSTWKTYQMMVDAEDQSE